jgi:hypothetical protein
MTDQPPKALDRGNLGHFLMTHSIPGCRIIRVRLPDGEVVDVVAAAYLPGEFVLLETEPRTEEE